MYIYPTVIIAAKSINQLPDPKEMKFMLETKDT